MWVFVRTFMRGVIRTVGPVGLPEGVEAPPMDDGMANGLPSSERGLS